MAKHTKQITAHPNRHRYASAHLSAPVRRNSWYTEDVGAVAPTGGFGGTVDFCERRIH